MKLSIVVTTYNLKNYIDEAIESILLQDIKCDYEVLIGDDGSYDGTVSKIKEWQRKYPQIIRCFFRRREKNESEKNDSIMCASKNRLSLAKHARGEYIAFLDGDDYYIGKGKFDKQVQILDKPENKSCIACVHDMQYYYPDDGREVPFLSIKKEGKIDRKLFWGCGLYLHAESAIYRNWFLQDGGINIVDRNWFDDDMILFYALANGDVYYIPGIYASYRQNPTTWKQKNMTDACLAILYEYELETRASRKMKGASCSRHYIGLRYLLRNHSKIDPEKNAYLVNHYKHIRNSVTANVINYKTGTIFAKMRLWGLLVYMGIRRIPYYVICLKIKKYGNELCIEV